MGKASLQIKAFAAKIERTINSMTNAGQMRIYAKEAIRLIVERTRAGYAVRRNLGAKVRHKKLSKSYIQYRKLNSHLLSSETSPAKSNLTFTGQMLDSMKIISVAAKSCLIGPKGRRRGSKGRNEDIAGYLLENGRPFNYLSRQEFNELKVFAREEFGRKAKRQRLTVKRK